MPKIETLHLHYSMSWKIHISPKDVDSACQRRQQVRAHPLFSVTDKTDSLQGGHPALELIHPVVQRWLGHQNHVRPWNAAVVLHVTQQRNGLKSLSQTLVVPRKLEWKKGNGIFNHSILFVSEKRKTWSCDLYLQLKNTFQKHTISSARIPLMPFSYREISQFNPRIW